MSAEIAFGKDGLAPCVAVDYFTNEVLMLAYVSKESIELTKNTGFAHYYSRSRSSIWKKGETSGNLQKVVEIKTDCDCDSVMFVVVQSGVACHTGKRSCFFNNVKTFNIDFDFEDEKSVFKHTNLHQVSGALNLSGYSKESELSEDSPHLQNVESYKNLGFEGVRQKRRVAVFGSTGSVGVSTMQIIKTHRDDFEVHYIGCGGNISLFREQVLEFKPKVVSMEDEKCFDGIKDLVEKFNIKAFVGKNASLRAAVEIDLKMDITVVAISGFEASRPTFEMLKKTTNLAIANKETIVCFGLFFINEAKKYGVKVLPVDSEHNSIFQILDSRFGASCLDFTDKVKSISITASGGAMFLKDSKDVYNASVSDVLKHPNWSMGKKITVDSSTMANKGLEVIEACNLFSIDESVVNVYIHQKSIVHGMVSFFDGSNIAFLSNPDMKVHISHALFYPRQRYVLDGKFDLSLVGGFEFCEVDYKKFPLLKLARSVSSDVALSLAFNASNEVAVSKFLNGDIKFGEISEFVIKCVDKASGLNLFPKSAEDVFECCNVIIDGINGR